MTAKSNYTDEEWATILGGPPSAGLIVMAAERGGSFREAFAMAKVYAEARQEHGESELLDEIAAQRPHLKPAPASSPEDLRERVLPRIRAAMEVVERKGTPQEAEEYRAFVATVAKRVAAAKKERGADNAVSEDEAEAIAAVEGVLQAP